MITVRRREKEVGEKGRGKGGRARGSQCPSISLSNPGGNDEPIESQLGQCSIRKGQTQVRWFINMNDYEYDNGYDFDFDFDIELERGKNEC